MALLLFSLPGLYLDSFACILPPLKRGVGILLSRFNAIIIPQSWEMMLLFPIVKFFKPCESVDIP